MLIKSAESRVKIYAWRNATRSSRQSIKITKNIETGARARESKINIKHIRLNTMMCPAVIFANSRIIRAKGLENNPIISTGIITGNNQKGTPGVAKMCFQYALFPLNWVTRKVQSARVKVSAMLPVTLAPKGGGNGISPIILLISIKKNTVSRYGIYLSNLIPRLGIAISSRTKSTIGSRKLCIPLGGLIPVFLYERARKRNSKRPQLTLF